MTTFHMHDHADKHYESCRWYIRQMAQEFKASGDSTVLLLIVLASCAAIAWVMS